MQYTFTVGKFKGGAYRGQWRTATAQESQFYFSNKADCRNAARTALLQIASWNADDGFVYKAEIFEWRTARSLRGRMIEQIESDEVMPAVLTSTAERDIL